MDYLDTKGRIFDIQKYSIHDGPGIRTIVFLKGCSLRCKWCSNPEGQRYEMEEMEFAGDKKIIGRDVTVREIIEEIRKDIPYYKRSGGGVTLSGGEATLQPAFARDLLRACKELGIDTAIETAGYQSFEKISILLPYLDHILMDIKHMDSDKHKAFTKQPNGLILDNARKIAEAGADLTIRVPVIFGFNDTVSEISQIAAFAKTLPGVKHLHLLPYHRMGEDKYRGLSRTYDLAGIPPMEHDHVQPLLEAARKVSGLICQIGG